MAGPDPDQHRLLGFEEAVLIVSVADAVRRLKENAVVAVPTETVYGLAARISSPQALEKIFITKARPLFDPLIVHVRDVNDARRLARCWPAAYDILAEKFWPGPLTLVAPKGGSVDSLITAGLDTVGIRSPRHPIAQEILAALDEPFAAPSANRFGQTSPTRAEHVVREFSGQVPVVDGGACEVGVESTVVRWDETHSLLELLRPGMISSWQLAEALKPIFPQIQVRRATSQASPGHLAHHYQPRLPLILVKEAPSADLLTKLAQHFSVRHDQIYRLELPQDARLAARLLYDRLHELSRHGRGVILYTLEPCWTTPEWEPLADRLGRAATPWP